MLFENNLKPCRDLLCRNRHFLYYYTNQQYPDDFQEELVYKYLMLFDNNLKPCRNLLCRNRQVLYYDTN